MTSLYLCQRVTSPHCPTSLYLVECVTSPHGPTSLYLGECVTSPHCWTSLYLGQCVTSPHCPTSLYLGQCVTSPHGPTHLLIRHRPVVLPFSPETRHLGSAQDAKYSARLVFPADDRREVPTAQQAKQKLPQVVSFDG